MASTLTNDTYQLDCAQISPFSAGFGDAHFHGSGDAVWRIADRRALVTARVVIRLGGRRSDCIVRLLLFLLGPFVVIGSFLLRRRAL